MVEDKDWLDKWNELDAKYTKEESEGAKEETSECGKLTAFTKQPDLIGHRNEKMADWLEDTLNNAKSKYYSSVAIMSDFQFDRFEMYLRSLRPNSKILKKVGYDLK